MSRRHLITLVGLLAALTTALAAAPSALGAAPPSPQIPDLVDASDSGTSATDDVTNDSTPTFNVNAGVAQAGMTVTIYAAQIDGGSRVAVGTAIVDAAGMAAVTTASISDDVYDVTATTKNGIGEESGHSLGVTVTIDTQAPTVTGAPFLVNTGSGNFTFTQTPTLGIFIEGDDPSATLATYEGTTLLGTGMPTQTLDLGAAGGIVSYGEVPTANPLSDGTHTVYAKASDIAGNESAPSASLTITIDGTPPVIDTPDLLAADDDGPSSTDNSTKNPRPRFVFATEPSVRVILFEDGIAIGAGQADATGAATIRVNDLHWLDPGVHCIYAKAIDSVGHTSAESAELCVTIEEGGVPFTSNLGADLQGAFLTLSLRSTLAAKATIRVLANGKKVKFRIGKKKFTKVARRLKAGKRKTLKLKVSKKLAREAKIRVVASVKSSDGRRLLIKKRALAKRAL